MEVLSKAMKKQQGYILLVNLVLINLISILILSLLQATLLNQKMVQNTKVDLRPGSSRNDNNKASTQKSRSIQRT